jgi:uncharacterized membrane protein
MRKWIYFVIISLISFGVIIRYALTFDLLGGSDATLEYGVMRDMISKGTWRLVDNYSQVLLLSAWFTTYFPALISTYLNLSSEMVYRIWPVLFIMWTPGIIYLIVRKYMAGSLALVVSLIFASQNYYLWSASYARIGIAEMFFCLGILVMLNGTHLKRTIALLCLCAVGIVLSHYGIAFVTILLLAVWLVGRLVFNIIQPRIVYIGSFLIPLVIMASIWYGVIIKSPIGESAISVGKSVASGIVGEVGTNVFSLSSRESVVQVALGQTLGIMSTPQKIEFVVSWIIIAVMTFGAFLMVKRRRDLFVAVGVSYLLILAIIISPIASQAYSVVRVYYQMGVFLMVALGIGITWLSKPLKINPTVLGLCLLIPYGLSTSGLSYIMMGVTR